VRIVQKAVERGRTADYWLLSNARQLPKETLDYVPAVLAAMRLADNSGTLFGQYTDRVRTKGGIRLPFPLLHLTEAPLATASRSERPRYRREAGELWTTLLHWLNRTSGKSVDEIS